MKPTKSHVTHHYVPAFLLKRWHASPEEKLTAYRWANGQVVTHRYKADSVAKARHLYTMRRSASEPDVRLERDFLGPQVDEPAAVAHAQILQRGLKSLHAPELEAWSRFLVSLLLRGPRMIQKIRERGRSVLAAGLEERPDDFLDVRGNDPANSLREWVEVNVPDLFDDLGVRVLPELIESDKLNSALVNATWGIRRPERAGWSLLIGDTPLIVAGTFETTFLAALPITPHHVFFATNSDRILEKVNSVSDRDFARAVNASTVSGAQTYVYGTSEHQRAIVAKRLRPPESGRLRANHHRG